jgi:predicted  nucleic acid-binding Zn-ribbon protein
MRIAQMFLPLAAALIIAACGNKEPATNAVTQAEAALGGIRDDAAKFAPDELKAPEATLAKMKDSLAKEDYRAVVAEVPPFNAQIKALQEAMVTKQTLAAAAQNEWDTLNAEVPKAVEEIQVRVDALSGSKLPKEITKQTLETAKTELETMKATWTEATAAAGAGDTQTAAEKGRTVQAKAQELKGQLGLNPSLASAAPPAMPATN